MKKSTPQPAKPSTLREVKNASSPSTVSSPPIPNPPTSPGPPSSPGSVIPDFNSSELEEDSELPEGGDYTEYPPDDSRLDLNEDFEGFQENSRLESKDEGSSEYYSAPDDPSVDEDDYEGFGVGYDEITQNLGNPAGDTFHPFNPHTYFDEDDEETRYPELDQEDTYDEEGDYEEYEEEYAAEPDQEILNGEYRGDEDDQNLGGPRTPRTSLRDGTTLDPVTADNDMVDGEVEVELGLESIDDDSWFNEAEELERARKSRLKEKNGRKP